MRKESIAVMTHPRILINLTLPGFILPNMHMI